MTGKKFFILTVCILAVLILAENCTKEGKKISREMYRYIPKDIDFFFSMDFQELQQIKGYPVICSTWEDRISDLIDDNSFLENIKKAGIDFNKDVDRVIIFLGPLKIKTSLEMEIISKIGIAIKFNLDNNMLSGAINTLYTGDNRENYLGVTINTPITKGIKYNLSIALIGSNHLLIARKETIKTMIDVYKGKKAGILSNRETRHFINSEKESQIIRFIMFFDFLAEEIRRTRPNLVTPKALESYSLYLEENSCRIEIICHSEFEIRRITQFLKNTIKVASIMEPRNEDEKIIFFILKIASVKSSRNSIEMRINVSGIIPVFSKIYYKYMFDFKKGKKGSPKTDL